MLYWSNNDLKAADQELKAAADSVPTNSPIRMRYVDFKLRTGAVAEAKAMLEDINKKLPEYLPPRVALLKIACAEHKRRLCCARPEHFGARPRQLRGSLSGCAHQREKGRHIQGHPRTGIFEQFVSA